MILYVVMTDYRPAAVVFTRTRAEAIASAAAGLHIEECPLVEGLDTWLLHEMIVAARVAETNGATPVIIPDSEDAFLWAQSEMGEAAGALVASRAAWKRNNPDKHLDESFEHEVHQAIMMLLLAGGDPIDTISEQIRKWRGGI